MTDITASTELYLKKIQDAYSAMQVLKQETAKLFQHHLINHPELTELIHTENFDDLFKAMSWSRFKENNESLIAEYRKDIEQAVCESFVCESMYLEQLKTIFDQMTIFSKYKLDQDSRTNFINCLLSTHDTVHFNAFITHLIAARYFIQIAQKKAHEEIQKSIENTNKDEGNK